MTSLTDQIMNDRRLSSDFKANWLNVLNFNIYINNIKFQSKSLYIDTLINVNDKYNHILDYINSLNPLMYTWINDLKKEVLLWKKESDKLILEFL